MSGDTGSWSALRPPVACAARSKSSEESWREAVLAAVSTLACEQHTSGQRAPAIAHPRPALSQTVCAPTPCHPRTRETKKARVVSGFRWCPG